MPSVLGFFGGLMRLLLIIGLIAIVAYYLYQIRDQLARWWASLFARDLGDQITDSPTEIDDLQDAPPRPFSSFTNPIGREPDARRVVVITFHAYEAWARERGFARRRDETPSGFVDRLRMESRQRMDARALLGPIENDSRRISFAYDRVVYGRGGASQNDVEAAKRIWQHMNTAKVADLASSEV